MKRNNPISRPLKRYENFLLKKPVINQATNEHTNKADIAML